MKRTVLITGASAGIGYELAKEFARHGYNLVLVARSKAKLDELATQITKEHSVEVFVLEKDLLAENAGKDIFEKLEQMGLKVDTLVNNAGFGNFGEFAKADINKELASIKLNVSALIELTWLFLQTGLEQNQAEILNVASTAAFFSGPYMSVYYATKNYVLAFSEALSQELKGTGITVSTLCPGPTYSDFQKTANMQNSKLVKGKKMMTSKEVAKIAYRGLKAKKAIIVPGFMNKIQVLAPRFLPRRIMKAILANIQKEQK